MAIEDIDPRVVTYGVAYLERRLPLTQIDNSPEGRRNVVSDLMFMGRYLKWIEKEGN